MEMVAIKFRIEQDHLNKGLNSQKNKIEAHLLNNLIKIFQWILELWFLTNLRVQVRWLMNSPPKISTKVNWAQEEQLPLLKSHLSKGLLENPHLRSKSLNKTLSKKRAMRVWLITWTQTFWRQRCLPKSMANNTILQVTSSHLRQ